MIDKRLFQLIDSRNLKKLVALRLLILLSSIFIWYLIAVEISNYIATGTNRPVFLLTSIVLLCLVKSAFNYGTKQLTFEASADLRLTLRDEVMQKAIQIGNRPEQAPSSALSQLMVEGIEQLEIYYARFLPQLFYCLLASLMIFFSLAFFDWKAAIVLLITMPAIPLVIVFVMKLAKKILAGYWDQYTDLGVTFKENLQGLSTLKAFNMDGVKQKEAADSAEHFRKITMKLLFMQLNSITIMDIISYSGAALGIGLALFSFQNGKISTVGMLMFILLSAEFFIPMRQLGSLFHVAMNGVSAMKKMFTYLETPLRDEGTQTLPEQTVTTLTAVEAGFQYSTEEFALTSITMELTQGNFYAFVGKSGSGKTTFAKLLAGFYPATSGSVFWNQTSVANLSNQSLNQQVIFVDQHAYLYPESLEKALKRGNPSANKQQLWDVLQKVQLTEFVTATGDGLDFMLEENGRNLSGGQRQRVILARALLAQRAIYFFDEITSGVDLESETIILSVLQELAKKTIVLFISHRLYNIRQAAKIFVFEKGKLAASGTEAELLTHSTFFADYFKKEQAALGGTTDE